MLLDRPTNLKMASKAAPIESVTVADLDDSSEARPRDDQVISLPIDRDTPNLVYVEELNKYVKNGKSFLYVSRVSRDRLCVVLERPEQAAMLVEEVKTIQVNKTVVPISFLVAKAVKIIISNAGYGISNSALKKYLTNIRKIRTASSVAELKANLKNDSGDFTNTKSFRRSVFIHPEDVSKLPQGPVKFQTPGIAFNVFFEVDNPKCFLCGLVGHFKDSCTGNFSQSRPREPQLQNMSQSYSGAVSGSFSGNSGVVNVLDPGAAFKSSSQSSSDNVSAVIQEISASVNVDQSMALASNNAGSNKEVLEAGAQVNLSQFTTTPNTTVGSDKQVFESGADVKQSKINNIKRPHSTTDSEHSSVIESELSQNPDFKTPPPPEKVSKNLNNTKNGSKKQRTGSSIKLEKSADDISSEFCSLLEPARASVEASREKLGLNFDDFVKLFIKIHEAKPESRREIALQCVTNPVDLSEVLAQIKSLVKGNKIKRRITMFKKALECSLDKSDTELSTSSELESCDES